MKELDATNAAIVDALNYLYSKHKIGEKQRELLDLGYVKPDAELLTRHLDSDTRRVYMKLDAAYRAWLKE